MLDRCIVSGFECWIAEVVSYMQQKCWLDLLTHQLRLSYVFHAGHTAGFESAMRIPLALQFSPLRRCELAHCLYSLITSDCNPDLTMVSNCRYTLIFLLTGMQK
jgi:hypothetical protein